MNKQAFLEALEKGLAGLPEGDAAECLSFYSEMIEDKIEEGKSEAEALAELGSVEEIVTRVLESTPLTRLVGKRLKPRRALTGLEIALLVLGAPIWLSLLAAAFSVVVSVFAVLWSGVAVLWSVEVSLAACGVGGVLGGAILALFGSPLTGVALVGAGLALAGLSIFFIYPSKWGTLGILRLCRMTLLGIKRLFVKGGSAQ